MRNRIESGFSLVELLIVVAIIGLMALVAFPSWMSLRRRVAVRDAASELRAIFHVARSRALANSSHCGIKFQKLAAVWHFALYDDGDGDGIRNDDITRGVDRRVGPLRVVFPESGGLAKIALPSMTIVDPDGDRLPPTREPVQFNRSTICSFSPLGHATPGTIYLTDKAGEVYAVRVYGATAKMRVLRYVAERARWEAK